MPRTLTFEAIGTHWQIDLLDCPPPAQEAALLATIHERIELFDQAYSRFRFDSLVTKMSQQAGTYQLPPDAAPLVNLYYNLYTITNNAFTPLIGQVLSDAGYDATYSLKSRELHTPPRWEDVIGYNPPYLTIKKPVLLDFGAAGKGYLVDLVSNIIQEYGITSFCVDAGGDILYTNKHDTTLRVGLEHPENTSEVIGVAELLNNSICGSAGNRRAWGNFHHIINPHTLTSPRAILATWVIAENALLADALATCLFFVPASTLLAHYTFKYVIMFPNHSVEISPQFPGEIFTEKEK